MSRCCHATGVLASIFSVKNHPFYSEKDKHKIIKFKDLKKNKIEGTPILKLAIVKRLWVKKFQKNQKKIHEKVHRKSSPEKFTHKVHPISSSNKFTQKV